MECIAGVAKSFTQGGDITVNRGLADSLQRPELHLLALGLLDFVQREIFNCGALEKNLVNSRVEEERLWAITLNPFVNGVLELRKGGRLRPFFGNETGLFLNHARAKRAPPILCLFEIGQTRRTSDFFTVQLEIHRIEPTRRTSLIDPHLPVVRPVQRACSWR